tara:strand:+ start:1591 stop:1833 length:243 start_codon:yes stop_codon:yes gene_type:complete
MKVKELIKELQEVPNQNARVELYIPYTIGDDTSDDVVLKDFEVHSSHALNEDEDNSEYVELYSLIDLHGHKHPCLESGEE